MDVAAFYRDFDKHPGDRVSLFRALANHIGPQRVLYPGSYVDVAPSVIFDHVTYVDMDNRANRFFANADEIRSLIGDMRRTVGAGPAFDFDFVHADYREPLNSSTGDFDLLVSLYAGFVSEHCTRYLRPGGHVLANNSHGDASMAALDPDVELVAVLTARGSGYRVVRDALDGYMIPKKDSPTIASLHESGRGVAFTKQAFAYLFRKSLR